MTVVITTEDMQKRRNDVKARTTLLLAIPDEHQLRFSKYETTKELWEAILKTFGGNEATKKTKKNQLKQQYGNFKAESLRLVSKPSIDCRLLDDLDTMSLDDVYNHLKVYEPKVQKKSETNSQNMAFISSSNTSSGKGEVHTAGVPTASTQVSTTSTNVAAASISHDTVCAYIASQLNGSQIKYEDITQINEDDIKEIDIKWNMALLSMRADRFWKKSGKKITIQGYDVAGFDKSKSYMASEEENHALVADDEAPTEFSLMAKSSSSSEMRHTPSIDLSKSNTSDLQNSNSFVSEHVESSSSIMSKPMIKFVKAADCPRVIKTNKTKTARKSPVKYAEMYKNTSKSPKVRDNQRKNWPKNNFAHKNVTPRAVLLKTGRTPIAQLELNLEFQGFPLLIWETIEKLLRPQLVGFGDLNKTLLKKGNSQNNIDDKGYWDSGCSQHMTGNISYLSEYEPYDGGYVSFGQGGGNITGKGIIKTSKLKFKNVYLVKELKYNLFSVSQICDNKNSVLFTDFECIVLGKDFKLKDDTNVLLRTPRQHNMYSIDLNNVVPHKNLTCLIAKAFVDESKL
nr:ribonuclease H-like domain-containing protein [Tanacetum cinerariifolium]